MQAALRRLELIETANWLLSFDKPMQKVSIEGMQKEYADIMADLRNNLNTIPNVIQQQSIPGV